MSIRKLIGILVFTTKTVVSYSQSSNTLLQNLFNEIPLDSSLTTIVSFVQKSNNFDNVRIYTSEEGIIIRGSMKNIKPYKYKADTAFINGNVANDLVLNSKVYSIEAVQIFKSRRKVRNEFKAIKNELDQIVDLSLRHWFTINDDKFLNYSYQLFKERKYPEVSISLETEREFLSNKRYTTLTIQFVREFE